MASWPGNLWLTGMAYCRLLGLIAAYWPGLWWLTGLVSAANWSGLLAWLIMASWPGCLLLPDQAYNGYNGG